MKRWLPLTEAGDAELFAKEFGQRVRFDHRRGRWHVFTEHHWTPDSDGELYRLGLDDNTVAGKAGHFGDTEGDTHGFHNN